MPKKFELPKKNDFSHNIYRKLLKVPKGKVTTYGALAHAVGSRAYRAVGGAMNKNPYMPDVACHRVIAADRTLGGYAHGLDMKKRMLKAEGVTFDKQGRVNEEHILWTIR